MFIYIQVRFVYIYYSIRVAFEIAGKKEKIALKRVWKGKNTQIYKLEKGAVLFCSCFILKPCFYVLFFWPYSSRKPLFIVLATFSCI